MDSSQNAYNEDTSALVERLDCLERVLFRMGQSGLNSFQAWEKGRASHLTASALVLNYRKRKMADLQTWALGSHDWLGVMLCTTRLAEQYIEQDNGGPFGNSVCMHSQFATMLLHNVGTKSFYSAH